MTEMYKLTIDVTTPNLIVTHVLLSYGDDKTELHEITKIRGMKYGATINFEEHIDTCNIYMGTIENERFVKFVLPMGKYLTINNNEGKKVINCGNYGIFTLKLSCV